MNIRRVITILIALLAVAVGADDVSAQELSRNRIRGNVRTINNGGLVPIDSLALQREKELAAAHRDSLYYSILDSIGRQKTENFDMLSTTSRDSMRSIVAAQLKRDSLIRSRGDSISPEGKRIRLNKRGEVRKPFISDSMGLSKVCWLSLPLPGFGQIYNLYNPMVYDVSDILEYIGVDEFTFENIYNISFDNILLLSLHPFYSHIFL